MHHSVRTKQGLLVHKRYHSLDREALLLKTPTPFLMHHSVRTKQVLQLGFLLVRKHYTIHFEFSTYETCLITVYSLPNSLDKEVLLLKPSFPMHHSLRAKQVLLLHKRCTTHLTGRSCFSNHPFRCIAQSVCSHVAIRYLSSPSPARNGCKNDCTLFSACKEVHLFWALVLCI
jgi:hypothetical protein